MRMYEVCAKCGHVGRNYYVEKIFAIKAENGKEAAAIVRQIPRVKHDHRDAIKYVNQIDEVRYNEIILENELDPYFKCKNIQQQRSFGDMVLFPEITIAEIHAADVYTGKAFYYGKKQIRNPQKYIKHYVTEEKYPI